MKNYQVHQFSSKVSEFTNQEYAKYNLIKPIRELRILRRMAITTCLKFRIAILLVLLLPLLPHGDADAGIFSKGKSIWKSVFSGEIRKAPPSKIPDQIADTHINWSRTSALGSTALHTQSTEGVLLYDRTGRLISESHKFWNLANAEYHGTVHRILEEVLQKNPNVVKSEKALRDSLYKAFQSTPKHKFSLNASNGMLKFNLQVTRSIEITGEVNAYREAKRIAAAGAAIWGTTLFKGNEN